MKKSDINKIELGTETFTEKWWEKHKADTLEDDWGLGRMLKLWERYCPGDGTQVAKHDIKSARDTAKKLLVVIDKAKKNCGRFASETKLALVAYEKEVERYLNGLDECEKNRSQSNLQESKQEREEVQQNRQKYQTQMAEQDQALGPYETTFKKMQGQVEAFARQRSDLEARVMKAIAGEGSDKLEDIDKQAGDIDQTMTAFRQPLEEYNNALAGMTTVAQKLGRLKDRELLKQVVAFEKRLSAVTELAQALDEKTRDVAATLQSVKEVIKRGAVLLKHGAETKKAAEDALLYARAAIFADDSPASGDACQARFNVLTDQAQAVSAYEKEKSGSLSEDDAAELERLKMNWQDEYGQYLVFTSMFDNACKLGLRHLVAVAKAKGFKEMLADKKMAQDGNTLLSEIKSTIAQISLVHKNILQQVAKSKTLNSAVTKALERLVMAGSTEEQK